MIGVEAKKKLPAGGTNANCMVCGDVKRIFCKGVCRQCYDRVFRPNRNRRGVCSGCKNERVIYSRGLCSPCFKNPHLREQTPSKQGQSSVIDSIPGDGPFCVTLCKPGDDVQDEIPIKRFRNANRAKEECQRRNEIARRRRRWGRSFYFVSVYNSARLWWVDKISNLLDKMHDDSKEIEDKTSCPEIPDNLFED